MVFIYYFLYFLQNPFWKIARKLPFPMSGSSSRHQTFPTEIYKIKHISTRQRHINNYDNIKKSFFICLDIGIVKNP